MKIQTKYLGEVEANEKQVIDFNAGIPGFNDETQFMLLELPGNPAFQILQSVMTSDVAFVVTNPYNFYQNYAFELDANVKGNLDIKNEKDVTVFSIVTIKDPFETSTLNLKAPIIINPTSKRGKQYIINEDDYSTKSVITPTNPAVVKGV